MTKFLKNYDNVAKEAMHDLDQSHGLAGKNWSVAMAKKLGMNDEDIERYLAAKK